MEKKESLGEKIFGYIVAIALLSLWVWSAVFSDNKSNTNCNDDEWGNMCEAPDPRL